MITTQFIIQRDGKDLELWILGEAEPYSPQNLRGHPDHWTPGEGGSACVEAIFLDEDATIPWDGKLTSKEESEAEDKLLNQLEDNARDAAEYAAELKAEAMRDDY